MITNNRVHALLAPLKIFDQLLALLVVFIWGTNFVFIRYGLNELPPFTFAALRFTLVAIPLVFILPKPDATWGAIASYGLFIGLGQFGLLFWAMADNISPGLASLIVQMQVFFTVLLSAFLMKESVTRTQLISLTICFIGLMIVIAHTDATTTVFGVVLVLLAGLSWACGNLVVKHIGAIDLVAFLAWSSLFAVPPLILIAILTENAEMVSSVTNMSLQAWLILIWQVVGNTLIGYGLWNLLLNRYSAALVTPWALMVPVFGLMASAVLISEPMPVWKVFAALLIFSGLAINLLTSRSVRSKKV